MYPPKVCKYEYITFPFEFLNFLQFLPDIKVSQIHGFVYNIGFMTLSKTNSPQMQGKKSYRTFRKFVFECFTKPKVKSVQEACIKRFPVHILKFEIL